MARKDKNPYVRQALSVSPEQIRNLPTSKGLEIQLEIFAKAFLLLQALSFPRRKRESSFLYNLYCLPLLHRNKMTSLIFFPHLIDCGDNPMKDGGYVFGRLLD